MSKIIRTKATDVLPKHKNEHEGYEYYKRELVPKGAARQCAVSLYEIPPGKAAYPYHYHTQNEESFYIISGQGILKTPEDEKLITAGDFLFFPAEEAGAHKLTNASETEPLIYLDYDSYNEIDVVFYPDSGKIGIWGKNTNQVYKIKDEVDYYKDE